MDLVREEVSSLFRSDRSERHPVRDERQTPNPMELPKLRPTLQLWQGMVQHNGEPQSREPYQPALDEASREQVRQRAQDLRQSCSALQLPTESYVHPTRLQQNIEACALPVSKHDIIRYIKSGTRLDMEQVVAMTMGYLSAQMDASYVKIGDCDEFEEKDASIVEQLVNDKGTISMLRKTWMWRSKHDFELATDPREAAQLRKQRRILEILNWSEGAHAPNTPAFTTGMQQLRRRRAAMQNKQHLTFPVEMLPEDDAIKVEWSLANNYRLGHSQNATLTEEPQIISKHRFNRIQRLLSRTHGSLDITSVYVREVEAFIKQHGALSSERIQALEESEDAAAIAFSFVASMRQRQLKVVSDYHWTRFLGKGEGKRLLQNSPDVLTSFEGILVWHAVDLKALTAVRCPEGVRDHFSNEAEILASASKVCELMERYVDIFGHGNRENLVFKISNGRGGSGRGPVDVYNALCDEVKDCRDRAKAAGIELNIGPVHKFLAKDIMHFNDAWADDAFANGKVPGWVEYLATIREEKMDID